MDSIKKILRYSTYGIVSTWSGPRRDLFNSPRISTIVINAPPLHDRAIEFNIHPDGYMQGDRSSGFSSPNPIGEK